MVSVWFISERAANVWFILRLCYKSCLWESNLTNILGVCVTEVSYWNLNRVQISFENILYSTCYVVISM